MTSAGIKCAWSGCPYAAQAEGLLCRKHNLVAPREVREDPALVAQWITTYRSLGGCIVPGCVGFSTIDAVGLLCAEHWEKLPTMHRRHVVHLTNEGGREYLVAVLQATMCPHCTNWLPNRTSCSIRGCPTPWGKNLRTHLLPEKDDRR